MKVSILIPSCSRPEMLERMLYSLAYTTQMMALPVEIERVLVVDGIESKRVSDNFDCEIVDFSKNRRGALWAWNRALQISTGDFIVPAGDDQLFHKGWLDYAVNSHMVQLNGYGVVGMNDLAYNGNIQVATMFAFDRKYCKEVMGGIFAPPMYHYYCIDSEWNEKAKMLGKYFWDERSRVEHLHSAHGKRPVDELDKEKMDAGWMEIDNKTFEDRKHRAFPIEWSPII